MFVILTSKLGFHVSNPSAKSPFTKHEFGGFLLKIAIIRLIKVSFHILSVWVEMTQYFTNSQSWIIRFFNPLSASVAFIQKPVNWFVQYIYIRVTVALNGLNESRNFMRLRYESTWSFIESSRQEVFCEKGVLRNFIKFTGIQLCQCLFLNKVSIRRPATLLKKRFWHMCFPVNLVKFARTPFLTEHLWWLFLFHFSQNSISLSHQTCFNILILKQVFDYTQHKNS